VRTYIDGEVKLAFERTFLASRNSNAFSKIFASWNGDGEILGLFGILNNTDELVLLGEYALKGTIPSYYERFAQLQEWSRSQELESIGPVILLIVGICATSFLFVVLAANLFPAISRALITVVGIVVGAFTGGGTMSYWHDHRILLLLRQPPVEPTIIG
jgi:hypothetical protein